MAAPCLLNGVKGRRALLTKMRGGLLLLLFVLAKSPLFPRTLLCFAYWPPAMFQRKLRMPFCRWSFASGSSAARIFMLAKGPVVSSDPFFFSPNAYWPPFMCQRKLRSSHFYDCKGPFSLPKTLLV